MSTPDNSPKKPWAAELSRDAIKALQDAGLDGVYTGLMQSAVVRTALTGIVMMVGIKVFKVELSEAQVSDLVEVIVYLSVLIAVVFHRFRSTKKIMSVDEAVGLFRQQFVQIGERAVRRDMLAFLEKNNPKLYVVVQAQLNEMEREAEARAAANTAKPSDAINTSAITQMLLRVENAEQRTGMLTALKELDPDKYRVVCAELRELRQVVDSDPPCIDPP